MVLCYPIFITDKGDPIMKNRSIIVTVSLIIVFILGFFTSRAIYHQPTKELCIGIPITHNRGTFEFNEKMCLTNLDLEDEITIDRIQRLVASATPIEVTLAPSETPDYIIQLRSFKSGVFYLLEQVWITESNAIIGDWNYESNTISDASQLSKESTDQIIEIIERIEHK